MTSMTPVRVAFIFFLITNCGHAQPSQGGSESPPVPPPSASLPAPTVDPAQAELRSAGGALRAARDSGPDFEVQIRDALDHAKKARGLLDDMIKGPRLSEDDRRRLRMQRRTADLIAWHAEHWNSRDTDPTFRKDMEAHWDEMRKVLSDDFGPLEGKDTADRLTAHSALMQTLNAIGHLDPSNTKAFDEFADGAHDLLAAEGSSQHDRITLFDATVGTWRAYRRREWDKVLTNCKHLVAVSTWASNLAEFATAAARQCDTILGAAPSNDLQRSWAEIRGVASHSPRQ